MNIFHRNTCRLLCTMPLLSESDKNNTDYQSINIRLIPKNSSRVQVVVIKHGSLEASKLSLIHLFIYLYLKYLLAVFLMDQQINLELTLILLMIFIEFFYFFPNSGTLFMDRHDFFVIEFVYKLESPSIVISKIVTIRISKKI